VRVAAVLTEYQAFRVRQWDEENRKRIRDKNGRNGHSAQKPGEAGH
jgi:hypothetical protein